MAKPKSENFAYPATQTRFMSGVDPKKQPAPVGPYDPYAGISPQMLRAIKNSPKGKLPPSLAKQGTAQAKRKKK